MRELGEEVSQISIWLDFVRLCSLDQTVEGRTGMRSSRRSTEKPVLSAGYKRADRILNQVRVRGKIGTVQIPRQFFSLLKRVVHGFAQKDRRRNLQSLRIEPLLEIPQDR